MRGDVHRLSSPRTSGHEQQGARYAVVVMADWKVMCEQVAAVDLQRLGPPVSHLTYDELTQVSDALRLVLDLGPQPSSLAAP